MKEEAMKAADYFQKNVDHFSQEMQQLQARLNTISRLRLFVFLAGVILSFLMYAKGQSTLGDILVIGSIVIFVCLVLLHRNCKREVRRAQCKMLINSHYLDRINGNWFHFKDKGFDFVDAKHPYTSDIDIFGHQSLYQWINIGNTYYGREKLHQLLVTPVKSVAEIHKRQVAVAELADKRDFSQELQCRGMLGEEVARNPEAFLAHIDRLQMRSLVNSKWFQIVIYGLPVLTVASIIAVFTTSLPPVVALSLLGAQLLLTAIGFMKNSQSLQQVFDVKHAIEAYKHLIDVIERETFATEHLKNLQAKFSVQGEPVARQLNRLERLSSAIDMRYSALLMFILNGLFLWDFHCVARLEKWMDHHGRHMRAWVETIGEFEALASLAVIRQIHSDWTFPEIEQQQPLRFVAEDMGHPLIASDKRVSNSIAIEDSLGVVTGSNMSGKTTLLRTIGINLVLAYAGAPVCASKLTCSIMSIFTSMRIHDDLNSGISSFYAELLRIKMIIEYADNQQPMIFLVDEIFRGTNSLDRIAGAETVLRNLSKDWIIGLISTHDFELCNLENQPGKLIRNYHFTEHYVDNQLCFDYKLRMGRSQTRNARYLMEMVGIRFTDEHA